MSVTPLTIKKPQCPHNPVFPEKKKKKRNVCHGYTKAERKIVIEQPLHPLSLRMGGNCTIKNLFSDWCGTIQTCQSGVISSLCDEISLHICDCVSSCWALLPPLCVNWQQWAVMRHWVSVCDRECERWVGGGVKLWKWISPVMSKTSLTHGWLQLRCLMIFLSDVSGYQRNGKSLWAAPSSSNVYVEKPVG